MSRVRPKSISTLKCIGHFEGIRIYTSRWMPKGAGLALPGMGIIISTKETSTLNRTALLRHEFGHFLQARKTGKFLFYLRVGIPSLLSAMRNGKRGHCHHEYWTEVWANRLAGEYFRHKPMMAEIALTMS